LATELPPPTPFPTPFDQPPGPGGNLGGGPPPTNSNDSPEVQAARDAVIKDPNNPDAHLQLSLALLDVQETRPAMDEMMQAASLADPKDEKFFINAAEEYKKRDAWGSAAAMYMRLIPAYRDSGGMPDDMRQNLREAIYKAADPAQAPLAIQFDRIDKFDKSFAHIARGRHALYNNNIEEAKSQMEQARQLKPDMPEVSLLEAEIAMKEGDNAKAKDILTSLSTSGSVPEWISLMADNYLKTLQ
jgi:Tfp pilus assembly protein PilF